LKGIEEAVPAFRIICAHQAFPGSQIVKDGGYIMLCLNLRVSPIQISRSVGDQRKGELGKGGGNITPARFSFFKILKGVGGGLVSYALFFRTTRDTLLWSLLFYIYLTPFGKGDPAC
jgi:hypothetical protein